MRKIRLSDTDVELFDIEVSPTDYNFYQKHKDAFKTMFHEQGKPFWTRFVITFRSFTVKHGVIKQMNIDSPKFQNLIDQAFIFIHERFVDAKANIARHFIEDVALLAQSQDRFAGLDSKSFAKDPFYARDTRELFRNFFGMPDQKSSYLKVYILSPVLLRFGGSICRCLIRWVDAIPHDPDDDSYWTPPQPHVVDTTKSTSTSESIMCSSCIDDCSTKYFRERIMGGMDGPKFIDFWKKGDPRTNDPANPLFAPYCDPLADWRENLTVDKFREFLYYVTYTYGTSDDKCKECMELKASRDKVTNVCRSAKKKKKKKDKDQVELIKDLKEVRQRIDQLEQKDNLRKEEYEQCIHDIIKDKPRVRQALAEAERQELLEKEKPNSDDKKGKKKKKGKKDQGKLVGGLICTHDSILFPKSPNSLVTGFQVHKTANEAQGVYEATMTVATSQTDAEQVLYRHIMEESLSKQTENQYRFNCPTLVTKIDRLPGRLEWFEGVGFCIAVIDFEIEEKKETDKWTNFTLMVSGYDEITIKHVMLKLLVYVGKRKKRTCYGWYMQVDDVVACLMPEELPDVRGITIKILRGVSFEDRLTEKEKQSFMKHQPYYKLDTYLLHLQPGVAAKIHKEFNGHDKIIQILTTLTRSDAVFTRHLQIFRLWEAYMKGCGPPYMVKELHERFLGSKERFELVALASGEIAQSLRDRGLKRIEIRYYCEHINQFILICPYCKIMEFRCDCYQHPIVTRETEDLIDRIIAPSPDEPLPSCKKNLSGKPQYGNAPKVSEDTTEQKIDGEQKNKKKKKSSSQRKKERKLAAEQTERDEKETSAIEKEKDKGEKQEAMATLEETGEEDSGQCDTTCLLNYFKRQLEEKEQEIRAVAESKMRQIINDTKWDKSVKDGMLSDVVGGNKSLDSLLDLQEQIKLIEESENAFAVLGERIVRGEKVPERTEGEKINQKVIEKSESESTTEMVQNQDDDSKKDEKEDNESNSKNQQEIKQEGDDLSDKEGKDTTEHNCKEDEEPKQHDVNESSNKTASPSKVDSEMGGSGEENMEIDTDDCNTTNGKNAEDVEDNVSESGKSEESMSAGPEDVSEPQPKNGLKNCSSCGKLEPSRKVFKKCQKCKQEGVQGVRYYCGRDCQVADWLSRHKAEHRDGLLV